MPRFFILAALILIPTAATSAGDWWKFGCHHTDCHCCPEGVNKETREFWAEGNKLICIPGFRCPWWDCHAPVCGRVRHVKVLKRCECEVPGCEWKWEVECQPCVASHAIPPAAAPAAEGETEESEDVPSEEMEVDPSDAEPALPPHAPAAQEVRTLPLNSPIAR